MAALGQLLRGWRASNGGDESLVGLLVVVAIVVAQIVKGLRQFRRNRPGTTAAPPELPPRSPPPAPAAGPDEELRRFLESLSRPAQAREATPREAVPLPRPKAVPAREETIPRRPEGAVAAKKPTPSPPRVPERLVPQRPVVVSAARERKAAEAAAPSRPVARSLQEQPRQEADYEDPYALRRADMAAAAQRRRQLVAMMAEPRRLRRAILVREILGPPVALR